MFLFITLIYFVSASLITRTDNQITKINVNPTLNYSLDEIFSVSNFKKIVKPNSRKISKNELVSFVSSLNKISYSSIVFTKKYSGNSGSFFRNLALILHEDYDPINSYFMGVNDALHDFSEFSKSYCLDAVDSVKQHGVFLEKAAEENVQNPNPNPKSRAFFFATAAAFVTGDFVPPVSVLMASDDSGLPASNEVKLDSDLLFTYSKIYCINTFSLHFDYRSEKQTNNMGNDQIFITIVGDKINYQYFVDYMNFLEEEISKDLTKGKNIGLDNVLEQLEALKIVALKLEQLVVFELTSFTKMDMSFPKIQKYISSKVSELVELKNQLLIKDFPILQRSISEKVRLNALKRELDLIKHSDQILNARSVSDQKVTNDVLQNELNGNEFDAFAALYIYGPLKRTTKMITRAVIALPEGVTVGGLQGIYDFLRSIWKIFFGNPVTSAVITIGGLAVIYSSVSTVYNFVSWIFFPFLFLKKLVSKMVF